MLSESYGELTSSFGPEVAKEMLKLGITRVSIDHFHYKDFRYTNVKDAIAQARRQQPGASEGGQPPSAEVASAVGTALPK